MSMRMEPRRTSADDRRRGVPRLSEVLIEARDWRRRTRTTRTSEKKNENCFALGMVVPDFALEMVVSDFGNNGRARLCFGKVRVRLWEYGSCPTLLWKWSCPTLGIMLVPDFTLEMVLSDLVYVCVMYVCPHSPVLHSCETIVFQAASGGGCW